MANGGYMSCNQCGEFGPSLVVGQAMCATWEVCRCKRCSGLVSRLTREQDPATGEWIDVKSRPRCKNVVGFMEANWGEACGSRALAPLPEGEYEYTMPCPRCGDGEMSFTPTAIVD